MKHFKSFLLAVFAGFCIGLGGLLNLICRSYGLDILGGFIFSIGLLLICLFGFNLFTGKVGYFFEQNNKKSYLLDLLLFYLGNFVGAVGFGYTMRAMNIAAENEKVLTAAQALGTHKLVLIGNNGGIPWYALFILSIFCGIMVFMAVELFKRETSSPLVKVFGILVCVGGFVVSGFEHCIADMFYLAMSGQFTSANAGASFLSILLGSSGNIVGAFAAWYGINYIAKKH